MKKKVLFIMLFFFFIASIFPVSLFTTVIDGDRKITNEEQQLVNRVLAERYNTYYFHSDHLGSAQLITDWRGEEYERIEYTPYGELWIEKVRDGFETINYRFTGKEMDSETGLYYFGARYLDPKYSRWLSTDPALGDYVPQAPVNDEARKANGNLPGQGGLFNQVNFHLYHYAGNNPVRYIDPNGEETYDSGITEEQYNNSWLLQQEMSWEETQSYFNENPNGVLHRPEDQFSFMKLESKEDIVDINSGSMMMLDFVLIGKGFGKSIGTKIASKETLSLSKNLQHHILSRHTLSGLKNQVGKAPTEKLLKKTVFNPNWSDTKVLKASEKVINAALKSGVTNGTYTKTIYGESVTAAIVNGIPRTVYGSIKLTEEMLK